MSHFTTVQTKLKCLVTLKKANITSREKGLSGMPDGFGELLSRQDLRNLVEFLASAKQRGVPRSERCSQCVARDIIREARPGPWALVTSVTAGADSLPGRPHFAGVHR